MQIKTATLVGTHEFVYEFDEALDRNVEDFDDRYMRFFDTGDSSHLPLIPGAKPVIWKLRHLRGRPYARLLDLHRRSGIGGDDQTAIEAIYEAAALSLESVDELRDERGDIWEPEQRSEHGVRKLTEQALGQLASIDDGRLILHLGRHVIARCVANPT